MYRSQSVPGLGKGLNPLRGYLGCSQSPLVSPEEMEAFSKAQRDAWAAKSPAEMEAISKNLSKAQQEWKPGW